METCELTAQPDPALPVYPLRKLIMAHYAHAMRMAAGEQSLPRDELLGYAPAGYRMVGAEPTRLLEDGDVIDLGNRSLEVLHLPGRSPGGIGLWEAETGSLFTSDMLYDGEHGLAWPPDEPESYIASLRRMRDLPVSQVYPGHYGTFDGTRMTEIIDEQVADLGGEL